jgi:hypothetical protein
MALNFPNSPTDGQVYTDGVTGNRWTWDNANTCWKSTSTFTQTITVASSAPGSPVAGQLWWNKDYGRLFVYYTDVDTSQWVDASPSDGLGRLAYNNSNTAFGVANTALQNTNVTLAGNLTVTGNVVANKQVIVTYTPSTSVNSVATLAGANTQGGTGYVDFLKATNLSGGATNPNKTFRLNSTGGIEVINSAYNSVIMSLGDDGTFGAGTRGISKSSMPAGAVLQVQSVTKTSVFSTASTTYTDVTGLSVSITPSSSTSKILVLASVSLGAGNILTSARLVRDSTVLSVGDAAGSRIQTSVAYVGGGGVSGIDGMAPVQNINYLDSPSTTNSTTYKIQMQVNSGTGYLNQASDDQNANYRPRMASTITVMEIAV